MKLLLTFFEGNAWFYNQNRPDIYWFRPGYPENEGPYGGEIITMPNDWERDSTSMKPLQAQFNTLGDFMELKLKIDPWSRSYSSRRFNKLS